MGNLDRFNAVLFLFLGVLGGLNSFDLECNDKPVVTVIFWWALLR
jgi:hypothetical protein